MRRTGGCTRRAEGSVAGPPTTAFPVLVFPSFLQERQLHGALKAQMPALLASLEQTRADLEAKESETLRLDGTVNVRACSG